MKFTDAYFEDEVRDGFYVSSMMKKAWAAQMEVLYEVQQLCERHHIEYFAEWGTLLGAVRHGGMIPWDDDLDICMLSKEYNRFLELADELPEGFAISEYHTNESDNMVIRVNNAKSAVISAEQLEKFHGFPYTAGLDIFRLDYLPKDKEAMKTHHEMVLIVGAVIGITMEVEEAEERDAKLLEQQEKYLDTLEKMCHVKFDRNKRIKKQLYHFLQEEVADLYTAAASDEVTNLPRWSENFEYRFPKRCYEGVIKVPFENMEIALPVGYDELLKKKYGEDFMKPIRAGSAHEYPYYDFFYDYLKENTSAEIYEYVYDKEEIEEAEKARLIQRENKKEEQVQYLLQFIPLFEEMHENIIDVMSKKEKGSAVTLIGDCQNSAIEIGNQIEKKYDSDVEVIGTLERYCEFLFQIYSQLSENNPEIETLSIEKIEQGFLNYAKQIETGIKKLAQRKEIVFIPYKAAYWDTMRDAWKEAMADKDTDVYVIPAPYFYKDAWGIVKKDEMQYEREGYPEEVALTSYEAYDFEVRHPDEIVIQCPYDEYNYAMTIHPFFYAKNLKQYTEQLVYIPALIMDEVEEEDSRAKKMLKSYCNMPGVVFADKVVVQSEQMKKVYVELLTEFAGEDTSGIWEKKIVSGSFDSASCDNSGKTREIPEEWMKIVRKADGTQKRIVLYTTSASALYCYQEAMLKKMSEVLEEYKEKQDEIALLWCPDRKVREVTRKSCPGVWRSYSELVQKFREDAWGIWDDSGDYDRAVNFCDEAFGDAGTILNAVSRQKKPAVVLKL